MWNLKKWFILKRIHFNNLTFFSPQTWKKRAAIRIFRLKPKINYSLPLELIWESLSWILCFLFFLHTEEKTPCTRDWEWYVLVLFSTIQMTFWLFTQQHNNWFFHEKPHHSCLFYVTQMALLVIPPLFPAPQCCRQTSNWTKLIYEVWLTNTVLESFLFWKKVYELRRSLSPKSVTCFWMAETTCKAHLDRACQIPVTCPHALSPPAGYQATAFQLLLHG